MSQTQERGERRRGALIAVVLILLFAGIAAVNFARARFGSKAEEKQEEAVPVEVVRARVSRMEWVLEQTGDIRPFLEVDVYPKISGKIIQTLRVEKGDFVKKGELLATLEENRIKAQIEEAEASLRAAKADLDLAHKDLLRIQNLFQEKAISKQRFDVVEARYLNAKARVEIMDAKLKQRNLLLKDHKIPAPISGYISSRNMDRGGMSDTRDSILRISSDETVKIVTTVTEKAYPKIQKGMEVEVYVDAFPDRTFPGQISVINPTIDPATRTMEIEVHLENKELTLRSGMFAHLRIHLGERQGVLVPRDTLKTFPGTGKYYVFVAEDGRAALRNLKLGLSVGNDVEILEGLSGGDLVVIKGQNRLKNGTPVALVEGKGRENPLTTDKGGDG